MISPSMHLEVGTGASHVAAGVAGEAEDLGEMVGLHMVLQRSLPLGDLPAGPAAPQRVPRRPLLLDIRPDQVFYL